MSQSLPIGKLRQNPTDYLRAVTEGESFVITSHRRPVADLVPHRGAGGITGAELMDRLRKAHRDTAWLDELRADREAETGADPWE
ncbi:type II toxin-antitoxin system Phd/YefM family antitoxin [uncultured Agrococcus sp.]|uniref:type II toxin-antitoxin system Phd/YefM family antitoxin n=1 Tax=uncultured Agrococcus sp. TaxID=382258 RepID=UPI0025E968AB|nr:type II toxin-antitoxin system prevent-host-death family antitoxin [uncultured Agrococcus sp.]